MVLQTRLKYCFYFGSALKIVPLEVKGWAFLPETANVSASDGPGGEFSVIRNCPEKIKNLNLIQSIQKQIRQKEKATQAFLVLMFWI